MTIFKYEGPGSGGGSGGFVTQFAFQTLTNGKNVYTAPPGHIVTPPARGATPYRTRILRSCSLVALSLFCATAPTAAPGIIIRTTLNAGAPLAQLTLPTAVQSIITALATPIALVSGDEIDFAYDIEANEGATAGTLTAWFV